MADLTKAAFYSPLNYLKKSDDLSGSEAVTFSGSSLEVKTVTVSHNLGYIPFHTVAANLDDADIIWSSNTDPYITGAPTGDEPFMEYWCTDTTLTIRLVNSDTSPITGDRTVYWNIYLDYGG